MSIVYRKSPVAPYHDLGRDLLPSEVDNNFFELAGNLDSISQSLQETITSSSLIDLETWDSQKNGVYYVDMWDRAILTYLRTKLAEIPDVRGIIRVLVGSRNPGIVDVDSSGSILRGYFYVNDVDHTMWVAQFDTGPLQYPFWVNDENLTVSVTIDPTVFRAKWMAYYNSKISLLTAILNESEVQGNAAKKTAAQDALSQAVTTSATMDTALTGIASNLILSPGDKATLRLIWASLINDKLFDDEKADYFSDLSTQKTEYDDTYQELGTYLNGGDPWGVEATLNPWIRILDPTIPSMVEKENCVLSNDGTHATWKLLRASDLHPEFTVQVDSDHNLLEVGQIVSPTITVSYSEPVTQVRFKDSEPMTTWTQVSLPATSIVAGTYAKTSPSTVELSVEAHSSSGYTVVDTMTLQWAVKKFWGVGSYTNSVSFLATLSNELGTTHDLAVDVTAGAGQKIYYSHPISIGSPTFHINGFTGGFQMIDEFNVLNAHGFTQTYQLWESDAANLGSLKLIVS